MNQYNTDKQNLIGKIGDVDSRCKWFSDCNVFEYKY